jgi:2-polyprenyl-3-methyl-5-hydroxy-6-metoxy-1,4-benzoquinol methylase
VSYAIALAELIQGRELNSVLDIGAGEGRWQPLLSKARPKARYAGVEPSEWAVSHWGRRRNLRQGSLENLDQLGLDGPFDLVICADVLHYLPNPLLSRGLQQIALVTGTLAFCPTFTVEDHIAGDHDGFQMRRADTYHRKFAAVGLHQVGPWSWVPTPVHQGMARLERV